MKEGFFVKQEYIWAVTLGEKRVEVAASDKFGATKAAAKKLGVRWSISARDMVAIRLRKVSKSSLAGRTYESAL